jgi:alpha-glucosidase
VWISPFYPSPMVDFGYDVSDYCNIDPIFGTLEDFELLVKESHTRDIKIIIDFVPNHTSDEHAWFKESSSGRHNNKRDWYVWRDPSQDGGPPNNWKSIFGGSAWQYHPETQQYYLHTFHKRQPDLNWDNAEVREAMKNVVKFWMDKGVDGLRLDAVSWLSKDTRFRNDPLNPSYKPNEDDEYYEIVHSFSCEGPKLFDYLNELIDTVALYENRFMITEAYPDVTGDVAHYLNYYEKLHGSICAPFNFECISLPWDANTYRGFIDVYQESLMPGQPPIYNMGNHDKPRLASRIGRDAARTAAMLLLTLPGMPFIYYGDEIGMHDVKIPENKVKDPSATRQMGGRDPGRTPMQWDASDNAGFSGVEPWLPLADDYEEYNVLLESRNPQSFLDLYKFLLRLRNWSPVMKYGSYRSINVGSDDVFAFVREHDMERYTVVLNFSESEIEIDSKTLKGELIATTYMDNPEPLIINSYLLLRPNEGVIIEAV